jgi:hypothetical protein
MASSHRASIRRRLARLTEFARRKVGDRQTLRERAQLCEMIRPVFAAAGIVPASLKHLWPVTDAPDQLARLGDTPALRCADAAFIAGDPALASRKPYLAGIAERIVRWRGRLPPGPGAAPVDWYAWALAQSDTPSWTGNV